MKKIIGWLMLVSVFVGLFAAICADKGLYVAIGVFLIAIFILLFIWIAIRLII
jgi:hypothetical protein